MSRGGSASGGQSSLGYLFGSDEPPKPAVAPAASAPPVEKPSAAKTDATKQVVAGVTSQTNNYHRADGQNTCNFLMSPGTPLSPPLILFLPHSSSFSPTSFSNPNRCRRDTTAMYLTIAAGTHPPSTTCLLDQVPHRRPLTSHRVDELHRRRLHSPHPALSHCHPHFSRPFHLTRPIHISLANL
jgi:protein SPIRAL1 and related proteins